MSEEIILSIIVPLLNEEASIPHLYNAISEVSRSLDKAYEIIFVDDGSNDQTLDILRNYAQTDQHIKIISFTKNFGHQTALIAGIMSSTGKYILTMDGDMQHPPSLIPTLYSKISEGYDVVGTIRVLHDYFSYKEFFSSLFYAFFNMLSRIQIVPHAADFRIITREVAEDLKKSNLHDIFIRGFIVSRNYKSFFIPYQEVKREYGYSKYSIKKMFSLALAGLKAYSYVFDALKGILYFLVFLSLYILLRYLFFDTQSLLLLSTALGTTIILITVEKQTTRMRKNKLKNEPLYEIKERIGYN